MVKNYKIIRYLILISFFVLMLGKELASDYREYFLIYIGEKEIEEINLVYGLFEIINSIGIPPKLGLALFHSLMVIIYVHAIERYAQNFSFSKGSMGHAINLTLIGPVFFFQSGHLIRYFAAVTLIMWVIHFIYNRSYIRAATLSLLAILTHKSTILVSVLLTSRLSLLFAIILTITLISNSGLLIILLSSLSEFSFLNDISRRLIYWSYADIDQLSAFAIFYLLSLTITPLVLQTPELLKRMISIISTFIIFMHFIELHELANRIFLVFIMFTPLIFAIIALKIKQKKLFWFISYTVFGSYFLNSLLHAPWSYHGIRL